LAAAVPACWVASKQGSNWEGASSKCKRPALRVLLTGGFVMSWVGQNRISIIIGIIRYGIYAV
jgi:hypothetical protein